MRITGKNTMPDAVTQQDILKHSVTRGDIEDVKSGGVLRLLFPLSSNYGWNSLSLPPELPPYWSIQRDFVLATTVHKEAMWAATIGIAITKMSSMAWEIESDIPLRAKRGQELLLHANANKGWVHFLSQHLRDFLTTDNGSHYEIVRWGKSIGSRIIGIVHLDSRRITRTGDPQTPVIYRDRLGAFHEMKDYQVVSLVDMPDPSETWNGIGFCSASRAYNAIFKLYSIEWLIREKTSGLHPLAIYIVNGLLDKQLQNAVDAAKEGAISRGIAAYMGAVIVPVPSDQTPGMVTIPLAELPNNFDRKEEFDIALLTYADSVGLDIQDIQPLTGQALGTGAQSQVLDEKGKGKGLASWRQQFTHSFNEFVLPELTTMVFVEKDYRDMERKAQVSKLRAEVAKTRLESQITTREQEITIMIDDDELPKEFMLNDLTPGDTLSDDEKPDITDENATGEIPEPSTDLPPVEQVIGTKELKDDELDQLIHQETKSAVELYEKAIAEV